MNCFNDVVVQILDRTKPMETFGEVLKGDFYIIKVSHICFY